MNDREIERRFRELDAELVELRRTTGNLPVRIANGSGGGSALPPGTGRYKVLQLLDDLDPATPGWDYPRFS